MACFVVLRVCSVIQAPLDFSLYNHEREDAGRLQGQHSHYELGMLVSRLRISSKSGFFFSEGLCVHRGVINQ
jgi:hypothetical protein